MGRHVSDNQPSSGTGTFLLEPALLACRALINSPGCRNKSTDIWISEASAEPFNTPSPLYRISWTRWLTASRQQRPDKPGTNWSLEETLLRAFHMFILIYSPVPCKVYSWDHIRCLIVTPSCIPLASACHSGCWPLESKIQVSRTSYFNQRLYQLFPLIHVRIKSKNTLFLSAPV